MADDVLAGQRAGNVLSTLESLNVFEQIRQDIIAEWLNAKTKETREECHSRMKTLLAFEIKLTKILNDGEYAAHKR